jgi:hypothetical protein
LPAEPTKTTENQKSKLKIIFAILILTVVLILIFEFIIQKPRYDTGALDGFAQCLAQKSATMYGAYWCSVCKEEKKAFNNSFRFVPYVECTAEPQKCLDAGIKGYPTWIFPDGRKFEGLQGVERLSQESGCSLK